MLLKSENVFILIYLIVKWHACEARDFSFENWYHSSFLLKKKYLNIGFKAL